MNGPNSYLSRTELAALLRVSLRTIDRLRRRGVIKGFVLGRRRLYERSEVRRVVEQLKREGETNG